MIKTCICWDVRTSNRVYFREHFGDRKLFVRQVIGGYNIFEKSQVTKDIDYITILRVTLKIFELSGGPPASRY